MALTIPKVLWSYRGFIVGSIKREFQTKYLNSLFGSAWLILNPISMIIVYTIIFSEVMKARLSGSENQYAYSIYLCAGTISWGLFSEIVGRSLNIFIDNANILKKLQFPKICLPVIVATSAFLNFSIIFGLFIIFLIITNNFPGLVIFNLIPIFLVQILFSVGLGLILGILNVFFRDIGQSFGIFLQFWFWFTPIVYPASILPEWAKPFTIFNPMAHIISGYQKILVEKQNPEWLPILVIAILSISLCSLGLSLFRKHSGEIVDEL